MSMLGISKDSYTDLATNERTDSVYLRLYVSAWDSGLFKELKPTNSMVLLTICKFMDEEGGCYPTQEQIAKLIGITKPTVNKAVKELLEFEFNGKPLISREIVQRGYFKNSVYKVHPISQVAIFGGGIEDISTDTSTDVSTKKATKKPTKKKVAKKEEESAGMSSKQIIDLFFSIYQEVYGSQPAMNFSVVSKMVKNKWVGKYTDEQLKTMIEVSVKEYDARWKKPEYQRPTLPALVSWIGEQALGLASNKEKEFKEVSEMNKDYVAMNEKAIERLQNRLNK